MSLRDKIRAAMKQPHWERERIRAGQQDWIVVAPVEDLITDILHEVDEWYASLSGKGAGK